MGKTKMSIDVATRFRSKIINSDKIQAYHNLDITTNKVPFPDRRGVPHHLLGFVDPAAGELSAASFRSPAASAIDSIVSCRKVPVMAEASNSLIHALVLDRFDPNFDPFWIASDPATPLVPLLLLFHMGGCEAGINVSRLLHTVGLNTSSRKSTTQNRLSINIHLDGSTGITRQLQHHHPHCRAFVIVSRNGLKFYHESLRARAEPFTIQGLVV